MRSSEAGPILCAVAARDISGQDADTGRGQADRRAVIGEASPRIGRVRGADGDHVGARSWRDDVARSVVARGGHDDRAMVPRVIDRSLQCGTARALGAHTEVDYARAVVSGPHDAVEHRALGTYTAIPEDLAVEQERRGDASDADPVVQPCSNDARHRGSVPEAVAGA